MDEISLLEEELLQLFVRSSVVNPLDKPTLVCTLWTKKSYNSNSFCAKMKSIWKSKKKFEIQVARQNLFFISFDSEEDLELIMEGRSWLFRKQLIIFNRLVELIQQKKIRLVEFPYWLKVKPCPLECDRKDLKLLAELRLCRICRSLCVKGSLC